MKKNNLITMNEYLENLLIKYFTTGNMIIDAILMYIFIEFISGIKFKYLLIKFLLNTKTYFLTKIYLIYYMVLIF